MVIAQVLEDHYFKGIYIGDTSSLANVCHPGTLLFGDIKGQPYAKTLGQYLEGVASRQSPKDSGKPFEGTIVSIDVINSIAVAKVHVKMYDFNFDEFLSFHKINNSWLIVNKMITDMPTNSDIMNTSKVWYVTRDRYPFSDRQQIVGADFS